MDNLFGTDGIRATIGREPLTRNSLAQCGHAIAQWALQKYGNHPTLLLSHDTRNSAHWIIAALQAALLQHTITLYTTEVMPTPAVCKLLQLHTQFDAGLVISASHNGAQDNGFKIIDGKSGKLSEQEELAISHSYYQPYEPTYNSFGTIKYYPESIADYIQHVVAQFPPNFLAHLTIVLDCANGATYHIAPTIFAQLGAQVIPINNQPNGTNINDNCGTLHMTGLQEAVLNYNANIGFAFDGDGDRVLIATQHAEIKNGDDILALLSDHPRYQHEATITGTIMSNHGLDVYLKQRNKTLIRTPVGDKYVAEDLEENNRLLGGEQSGHIILHDYLQTGDGIITALRILELLMQTGNWAVKTFEKFPQILINVPIVNKKDLADPIIGKLIADYESKLSSGRLVVRYSGTENVLRIMVEDKEEQTAHTVSKQLADVLAKELR